MSHSAPAPRRAQHDHVAPAPWQACTASRATGAGLARVGTLLPVRRSRRQCARAAARFLVFLLIAATGTAGVAAVPRRSRTRTTRGAELSRRPTRAVSQMTTRGDQGRSRRPTGRPARAARRRPRLACTPSAPATRARDQARAPSPPQPPPEQHAGRRRGAHGGRPSGRARPRPNEPGTLLFSNGTTQPSTTQRWLRAAAPPTAPPPPRSPAAPTPAVDPTPTQTTVLNQEAQSPVFGHNDLLRQAPRPGWQQQHVAPDSAGAGQRASIATGAAAARAAGLAAAMLAAAGRFRGCPSRHGRGETPARGGDR